MPKGKTKYSLVWSMRMAEQLLLCKHSGFPGVYSAISVLYEMWFFFWLGGRGAGVLFKCYYLYKFESRLTAEFTLNSICGEKLNKLSCECDTSSLRNLNIDVRFPLRVVSSLWIGSV